MKDNRRRLAATAAAGSLFLAGCAGDDAIENASLALGAEAEEATEAEQAEQAEQTEEVGLTVSATPDPLMGVNVTIEATGFRWAPEHASGEPVDGEGHAHLYVDGEKQGRLYGSHVHLPLEPGQHEIRVTLNGNDHEDLVVDGERVETTVTVEVPERMDAMGGHADEGHATEGVAMRVTADPDAKAGVNVRIETDGFTWSPEHASGEHVDGEGHAHLYVDGEKVGRVYGEWLHLSLEPGEHEIRVTLNGNDHRDYLVDGTPVEATVTVDVPEGTMH
jgi:hypothetical protein